MADSTSMETGNYLLCKGLILPVDFTAFVECETVRSQAVKPSARSAAIRSEIDRSSSFWTVRVPINRDDFRVTRDSIYRHAWATAWMTNQQQNILRARENHRTSRRHRGKRIFRCRRRQRVRLAHGGTAARDLNMNEIFDRLSDELEMYA